MSLINRIIALTNAIGADIKALKATTTVYEQAADPGVSAAIGSIWVDTDDNPSPLIVPVVTALPTSPVNGQECYFLADATNGVVWHLKYRAGSSSLYQWEYIGGPPLIHKIDTDQTFAEQAPTTYVDAATVGPQITLPLSGDFTYHMSANLYVASETGNAAAYVGLSVAGAAPAGPDVAQHPGWVTGEFGAGTQFHKTGSLLNRIKNDVLKMRYWVNTTAAGTAHARWRELQVTPIRVG